jgi:hypothetical protein
MDARHLGASVLASSPGKYSRALPGHQEGDLIMGLSSSAIGTLPSRAAEQLDHVNR